MNLGLFLVAGASLPALQEAPAEAASSARDADPLVLRVDGDEISRREYEDWMLRTYGERRAMQFAELLLLRDLYGTRPLEEYRDAVLEEFDVRIAGAFHGDREGFLEELDQFGRSYEGRLAERTLEMEYDELSSKLESIRDFRAALVVDVLPPLLPEGYHTPLTNELELANVRWGDRELVLHRKDFAAWMRRSFGEKLIERFVQSYLVHRMARQKKITVTDDEVRARTEEDGARIISDLHDGDREAWLQEIKKAGRTEATFRHEYLLRMRTALLVEKLIRSERTLSADEVRRGWEEEYGPGGVRHEIRWLRIAPELASAEDGEAPGSAELEKLVAEALAAAEREAAELRERIENGEDFATLVEKYSDDVYTRPRGGRPQDDFRIRQLAEPFQAPVLALEPGELSEPLTHGMSVYLFEKLAVRHTPFEEVVEKVRAGLLARRPDEIELAQRKNKLRREVEVVVQPALFR